MCLILFLIFILIIFFLYGDCIFIQFCSSLKLMTALPIHHYEVVTYNQVWVILLTCLRHTCGVFSIPFYHVRFLYLRFILYKNIIGPKKSILYDIELLALLYLTHLWLHLPCTCKWLKLVNLYTHHCCICVLLSTGFYKEWNVLFLTFN